MSASENEEILQQNLLKLIMGVYMIAVLAQAGKKEEHKDFIPRKQGTWDQNVYMPGAVFTISVEGW